MERERERVVLEVVRAVEGRGARGFPTVAVYVAVVAAVAGTVFNRARAWSRQTGAIGGNSARPRRPLPTTADSCGPQLNDQEESQLERLSFAADVAYAPRDGLLDVVSIAPRTGPLPTGAPVQAERTR